MHNCLVMGSGRSGTSLVAGTLNSAGYYVGKAPYPARDSNPKGFFESPEINNINQRLTAKFAPGIPYRWLAVMPQSMMMRATKEIDKEIKIVTDISKEPYCYKDPQFCYTLPAWRPHIRNTRLICVFRHPSVTATSTVKECNTADYLKDANTKVTHDRAVQIWMSMYRPILNRHIIRGKWLFIHMEQMFISTGIERLENFLDVKIDRSFPDPKLNRSKAAVDIPSEAQKMYDVLCDLAGFYYD